jgi:invasion protein IalB
MLHGCRVISDNVMKLKQKMVVSWLVVATLMTLPIAAFAQQVPPRPEAPRPPAAAPRPAPIQRPVPEAQPPAPQGDAAPQQTTATYADWVVQCQTQAGPPPQKLCDMAQVTQVTQGQGKSTPFSRVAIGHPLKGQPIKLVVQLPTNVSLATNVRIQTSDDDPGIIAPFARCLPIGCFADFDMKDETLRKLRAASGAGKLSFADGGGHDIAVPLSFNGFGQAFDALERE